MSEPDFVVCLECETPIYTFEWHSGSDKLTEALCPVCGNDETDQFEITEDAEAQAG